MTPAIETTGGLPQPRRAIAIAAVLAAMALVVLDAGMVNVALPSLTRAFHAAPAEVVPVVSAYQGALLMALLPCAALGERFGNRRVFQGGVALFLMGAVLCALAPSLPWLVAARFLQGLGGAAVMALGVALLRASVAEDRLGAAVGWNALAVALASAAAPAVGAMVVAGLGWPWLFLFSLPTGAAALLAARSLPRAAATSRRLDAPGMALNAAVFGLFILTAANLFHAPLTALCCGALGAAALVLLVRREAPKPAPLVPLDLLGDRSFRLSVVASVCVFTGQAAALVALPFYLHHGLGLSPMAVGLCLSPWPLSVAAASMAAGRLSDRIPTARLCMVGGALLAGGLGLTALWPLDAGFGAVLGLSALCGVGFGLFQVPNNRNLFLAAPAARSGAAGGMQGTARLTGQVSGAILMTLLFTAAPPIVAARLGLALGALFALAGGLVSAYRSFEKGTPAHAAL